MDEGNIAASIKTCMAAVDIVNIAKTELDITKPFQLFDDGDIRDVCRWIGSRAPDTTKDGDTLVLGKQGVDAMLFVSLNVFPRFYEKYELAQVN